jgi:phosphoenolpyruvate---glycerone phosphotransferase subunit DhaL
MEERVDYAVLAGLLRAAADKMKAGREYLSALDAATGDGDHGTAVFKVAEAIREAIEQDRSGDMKALLKAMGWAVMSTDAGSTSPLYGSLFMGMSDGMAGEGEIDVRSFVGAFEQGVAKLRKNTRADVGCKTMLDALVPALSAMRAAADSGAALAPTLSAGAEAAAHGAESTKDMKATFGRAKHLGERSVGHLDPGAASMSLLFAGMKEGAAHG